MGLFTRLLKVSARYSGIALKEDFFTEIVACMFATMPELLRSWLADIGLSDVDQYTEIQVSTQAEFAPLESHTTGSRFDILIMLSNGMYSDWIAIESKLDSREGDNQLPRYAEVLATQKGARRKFLLYVTRDYDPKDSNLILHNIPDSTVYYKRRSAGMSLRLSQPR